MVSLSAQTFADHEILVFDDGSTDNSLDRVEEAARHDQRVRLVGSERVGLVAALERAIACSDAEFIARMDADDESHPERLTDQVILLDARPELALASCLIRCFPDYVVEGGMRRYENWLNGLVRPTEIARDIFVESPLCHPSVTMRRAAYETAGGYIDDGNPEDYGLWLRFHAHELAMAKVPEVRFYWREHSNRLTRTDERYSPARFIATKSQHLLAGPLRDKTSVAVWGAGQNGRTWSRALRQAGIDVIAFIDVDRDKIGHTMHGAPIVSHEDLRRGIPGDFLLAAVGAPGARARIRSFLNELGLREPEHFICVA